MQFFFIVMNTHITDLNLSTNFRKTDTFLLFFLY